MLKIVLFLLFLCFSPVSSFANYNEVDLRAKNVPERYEKRLNDLVKYLIEPYKRNDELKARVIFAWIGYHVEYDMFKYDVITEKKKGARYTKRKMRTGDAFKTRVGVCGDIADLYARMGKLAGLEVEYITGYAGSDLTMDDLEDSGHAWNAVKINRTWYFVDATWGMSGDYTAFDDVDSLAEHRKEIRKRKRGDADVSQNRSLNNEWFLVPPERMVKTHFPKREKDQHLTRSVDMKKVFRENKRKKEREKRGNKR